MIDTKRMRGQYRHKYTVVDLEAIDMRVARAVFGLHFVKVNGSVDRYTVDGHATELPAFSSNIKDAWMAVDKLTENGDTFGLQSYPDARWEARLYRAASGSSVSCTADTETLAICFLALKVLTS